ncbi:MAG: DUF362 domain-containing protein [bacterium]|nr:DUF362 domain-containing protein [bacterium]
MTRREWLALMSAAPVLGSGKAPTAPVSIARCRSYTEDVTGILSTMFDQIGGIDRLVRGKTVTIKLNLTGSPALRVRGMAPGITHYCHPKVVAAAVHLIGAAGAKRIRLVESGYGDPIPLEEYMLDSGWNVRSLQRAAKQVEFENTNNIGESRRYARMKVPGKAAIFPAYDLNHSYEETDVFVSLAKLKEHDTCGVTMALKNVFGITPASIYGDDAGETEPNEKPAHGRLKVCHEGKRQPSKSAPSELDPTSNREGGYRVPRITVELAAARPIHLSIIDGVETIAGGEGPWIPGVHHIKPGLLLAGTNPVTTDAVSTAAMGFNPRAGRGTAPFTTCDNTMLLAESMGLGTADLNHIEVRGLPLAEAVHRFAG